MKLCQNNRHRTIQGWAYASRKSLSGREEVTWHASFFGNFLKGETLC